VSPQTFTKSGGSSARPAGARPAALRSPLLVFSKRTEVHDLLTRCAGATVGCGPC
jgi:hypothetical protein